MLDHRLVLMLACALVAGACGSKTTSSGSLAPPVSVKRMPPMPDLSKVRTFTEKIPGVPTDTVGLVGARLERLGDLKYPVAAWDRGLQGWAVYDLVVAPEGHVDERYVRLVAVSDSVFAKSAADAIRAARFVPATKAGKPVPTLVRLPVQFTLDRPAHRN